MIDLVNVRFNPAELNSEQSRLYRFFVVARHLLIDYRANSSGVHHSPAGPDRTFPNPVDNTGLLFALRRKSYEQSTLFTGIQG